MNGSTIKLTDGRTLGFSDCGMPDGIPMFLFHGTPGSRMVGLDCSRLFATHGIRVIAPERPGYGLSDPKPGRKMADWARDVEELADHLGLGQFHVAGGSGGGPYALACAINLPARVLSATLISSGTPPEISGSKDMAPANRIMFFSAKHAPLVLKVLLAMYAGSVKKMSPERFLRQMQSQLCESDRRVLEGQIRMGGHEDLMRDLKEAFRQGSGGAYHDTLLTSRPWRLDIGRITVPVFMWHGESDTLVPVAPARAFAKLIPGCDSHFIPGAGHLLLESEDVGPQIAAALLSVRAQ